MDKRLVNTPDRERAAREAAMWVARLHNDAHDGADLENFRRWRAGSPENADAMERITEIWDTSGGTPSALAARGDEARLPDRRRVIMAGAGAAAAIVVGIGVSVLRPGAAEAHLLVTGIGEQRTVSLRDGTRVRLDVCSRLSVTIGASARSAHLIEGRASLTLSPSAAGPMLVRVGTCLVASPRATLDLAAPRGGGPTVTVVRGDARVVEARGMAVGRQRVLLQGERLTGGARVSVDRPDLGNLQAWEQGVLVFDDAPLATVTVQMNQYGGARLLLADPAIGTLRVTGRFQAHDTEAFARSLELLLPVSVTRDATGFRLAARTG